MKSSIDEKVLWEQIAEKAYALYEKRGRVHGYHLEDWLEAERQVLSEVGTQPTTTTQKRSKRDAVIYGDPQHFGKQ